MPTIFSIASDRVFADDLAAGLLAATPDPLELARSLILLPNRRSVRAVTEAFVRRADGRALLLPRMAPIADVEGDADAILYGDAAEDSAPAMPPLARQLALARLLGASGTRRPAEALALAAQLAAALDTLTLEGCRATDVEAIDPGGELQQHWLKNRELLAVVMRHWPDIITMRGQGDPTARRVATLHGLARRWQQSPPPFAITVAGIVNAPPPVAQLLSVAARLPQGQLVLPGFDTETPPVQWQAIMGGDDGPPLETHPQFALAHLLHRMGVNPAEVRPWPHRAAGLAGSPPARSRLLMRAMAPPAMAASLMGGAPDPQDLQGLALLTARTPAEEALAIAIAMRQVVGRPGATAALVTPDRGLARRVRVQLGRFGIEIDDSAGEPLSLTAPGTLLLALAHAMAENFAPVALLTVLKHPLARAGEARLPWLDLVRALDRLALRGLRPPPGLDGVARRLVWLQTEGGRRDARLSRAALSELAEIAGWWRDEVTPLLKPLERRTWTGDALYENLRAVAESLTGPELWAGDAGRALAGLVDSLGDAEKDLAGITLESDDVPGFMGGLLATVTVRPVWRRHPQLAIWGPLEARLQSADVMILGGLNEGVWPDTPAPDPFLAPAIRKALGLPGLQRRIGLMAHDFISAAGAREVLLTRSEREGTAPSVPSRFWQRLQAVAGDVTEAGGDLLPAAHVLLTAARELDRPERDIRIRRPEPCPPRALRPTELSVTEVGTLKADPFTIYARKVMRLDPLDPLDAEPTGGDRGTVVHHILERWLKEPAVRAAGIPALVRAELQAFAEQPELAALWQRRVERMVAFVVEQLQADAACFTPLRMEARARMEVDGVWLIGRADRIDRGDKGYRIVDYKTGALPQVGKVRDLWDTQLSLLAWLIESGACAEVPAGPVAALEYWKLSGGAEPGQVRPMLGKSTTEEVAGHRRAAETEFRALIGKYCTGEQPFTAKIHPVHGRVSRDYDQLARLAEWLGR
ncbi:MAG: double-strand break repair protein AddB [Sphingomonadaceae bacterium]